MTPPVDGADFLAALVASCFLGAFPPVDFLAVCFVLAMLRYYCCDVSVFESVIVELLNMLIRNIAARFDKFRKYLVDVIS